MSVSERAERIAGKTGVELLDNVERFLRRFVIYPSEHTSVAHVLWIAHTHLMEAWESTPRIFFASPEPASGKSRALEVTEPLVPRPIHAVNTTPAYLFRKVSDAEGLPTVLYDEIDTVFGPRAKENEDIRGMLNAGHRKGAVAGRCVVRGKEVLTEELPAYCAVALAGLDDLPDTLMSRCVVVRMRRRAPHEVVEPFRRRLHLGEGHQLRDDLASWTAGLSGRPWPEMPVGVADRWADVWEALLYMADAAGGAWPERARSASVTLVTDAKAGSPSLGVRLLADVRVIFGDNDRLYTDELLAALVAMDEAPWGDLHGKPLDSRGLARYLAKYGVKPRTVRVGSRTSKGYTRADFVDPWSRYVTPVTVSSVDDSKRYMSRSVDNLGEPGKGAVTAVTAPQRALADEAPDDLDGVEDWTRDVESQALAGYVDGDTSPADAYEARQLAGIELVRSMFGGGDIVEGGR